MSKYKYKAEKKPPAYIEDGQLAIEQLGIESNENQKQDKKWLTLILGKYLRCGSWTRAQQHCRATSIGELDILDNEKKRKSPSKRCRCCGLLISQGTISLFPQLQAIASFGVCNLLYFHTILMIAVMYILNVLILCFYSLTTNIVASAIYRNYFGDSQLAYEDNTFKGILMTSFGSKRNIGGNYSQITIAIQCWLTFISISFMGYLLLVFKYGQKASEQSFLYSCQSPGKFSVFLANVPIDLYGKDKSYFQSAFQQYVEQVKRTIRSENKQDRFSVALGGLDQKIQVQNVTHIMPTRLKAFYKQRKKAFKQVQEEENNIRKKLIKIIQQRKKNGLFLQTNKQLQKQAQQINNCWKRQMDHYNSFMKQIKQMDTKKQRQKFKTLSVIVTFNNINNKKFILALHARQQSLMYNLFYRHFAKKQFFMLPHGQGQEAEVKIFIAPQPEDIIWENHTVTHPFRITMIVLMYLTTAVLLAISFVVVYYLSGQSQIMSRSYEYKKSFWIISLMISLFLQVFDLLIGFSIKVFTKWESHCSQTDVQTSIATKTIMAVLVNSTLIPACIYGLIKRNIFGVEGLADTIFLQSIIKVSTAILMPVIEYRLYLLKICWKRLTCNLLKVKQRQLNIQFEKPTFQIGKNLAQLIGLFYYGCFYCNLQPLVTIIVGLGIIIMYFSKHMAICHIQKKPFQGTSQITHAIDNFAYLGPIVFAVGNFLWADVFLSHTSLMARIPNILTLVMSLVIFVAPFEEYQQIRLLKKHKNQSQQRYKDQRIFFSSSYQRKNPLTENKANKQHQKYLRSYFKKLQEKYKTITQTNYLTKQQESYARNNFINQLKKLKEQFIKHNKFGYADEYYAEEDEKYKEIEQPCILVEINNQNPQKMMLGFDFISQLENELQMHHKFRDIPVQANIRDQVTDFTINLVNLQYLGFYANDLIELDKIVQKISQDQDKHPSWLNSYLGSQINDKPQYQDQINGQNHQQPSPLNPVIQIQKMQINQNPQLSHIPKFERFSKQYSRHQKPAKYHNNLHQSFNSPNIPNMTNSGQQNNIITSRVHNKQIELFTSPSIFDDTNQRRNLPRANKKNPQYM